MIEQTDDDPRSGRLMAIARLANETERQTLEVVAPELEESKATAIANLRKMIELLSDPTFLAKNIPATPPGKPTN